MGTEPLGYVRTVDGGEVVARSARAGTVYLSVMGAGMMPPSASVTLTADEAVAAARILVDAAAIADPDRCPTACSEGHTYEPPCALAVSAPRGAGEPDGEEPTDVQD